MAPVALRCTPESANPAHLYSASLAQLYQLERHDEELRELRDAEREFRCEQRREMAEVRQALTAVLEQHAAERGARRVWQLLAAAVPTVLVLADLVARGAGWIR